MRKLLFFCALVLTFSGCDTEEAPDCVQTVGSIVSEEILVDAFHELIVHKGIRLFLEQGEKHKVVIETGENLLPEISAEVREGRLILRNGNSCNLFREYNKTKVVVTVPDLSMLQNSGNTAIIGVGELLFPDIWLKASNEEDVPEVYTIADFKLQLVSQRIRITGDSYSNFFLSGTTEELDIEIYEGDGRLEAADLKAGIVTIKHQGTNKLILHPQQRLQGEIRSTGDVISVKRPPVVEVETFYTGKLYFK